MIYLQVACHFEEKYIRSGNIYIYIYFKYLYIVLEDIDCK